MNESKKIVSYTVQVKHRYLLNGLAWIVAGIFLIIPFKIFTMMSTVCIIATLYLKTMDFRKNKKEADEMAEANMNAAMARTLMVGEIILVVFAMVVGNIMVDYMGLKLNIAAYITPGLLIFLGLLDFLVGLFFKQEEQ